jgi:hypothetical protein
MEEVLAPIDEVTIYTADSAPPQYLVYIVSGLPSGCAQFKDLKTERSEETIAITVTNLIPKAGQQIACTAIYGMKEHHVNLGSDFEPGMTYTVQVNDVTRTFQPEGGSNQPPPSGMPHIDGGKVAEAAPVIAAMLEVTPGDAADNLVVTTALPNGCYEFADYTLAMQGDGFVVEIRNFRNDQRLVEQVEPDGSRRMVIQQLDLACDMVYREVETRIPLEISLEPCKFYSVAINGGEYRLQAVGPAVTCEAR